MRFSYKNIKKTLVCFIALVPFGTTGTPLKHSGASLLMNTQEIWKDIAGYENLYQASTTGLIKSFYKKGFLMKFKTDKDGYLHIGLTKGQKQRTFRVHRVIAETFIPNPNNLPQVNHKDLNKQNNSVDNLEWISDLENKRHYHKDANNNTGVLMCHKKYKAHFRHNNKQYYVGTFNTYEEAVIKYNEAFEHRDNEIKLKEIIYKNLTKPRKNV